MNLRYASVAMVAILAGAWVPAHAQLDGASRFDFDRMDAHADEYMDFNIETGVVERLKGNARIKLYSADDQHPPLDVAADDMQFTWPQQESRTPEQAVFEGNVRIEHPRATITSQRAEWNFGKDEIVFSGNPQATQPSGGTAKAHEFYFSPESGACRFRGPGIDVNGWDFKAGAGGSSRPSSRSHPALLNVGDVRDWPGLLAKIQAENAAEGASPGKHILGLLKPEAQAFFRGIDPKAISDDMKKDIVKQFNALLLRGDFYSEPAWKGVAPGPMAAALLAQGTANLAEKDRITLNRLLFEAAYPGAVAPYKPAQVKTD